MGLGIGVYAFQPVSQFTATRPTDPKQYGPDETLGQTPAELRFSVRVLEPSRLSGHVWRLKPWGSENPETSYGRDGEPQHSEVVNLDPPPTLY